LQVKANVANLFEMTIQVKVNVASLFEMTINRENISVDIVIFIENATFYERRV